MKLYSDFDRITW